jgi:hypothetical protein
MKTIYKGIELDWYYGYDPSWSIDMLFDAAGNDLVPEYITIWEVGDESSEKTYKLSEFCGFDFIHIECRHTDAEKEISYLKQIGVLDKFIKKG